MYYACHLNANRKERSNFDFKGVYWIFNVHNDLGVCCLREEDECVQALTEKVPYPAITRSWTMAFNFYWYYCIVVTKQSVSYQFSI